MKSVRAAIVVGLALGVMVLPFFQRRAPAGEAKVKTLLLVGGGVHDWKGVGDIVEETLRDSGKFDVTRVNNDLDAFLSEKIEPYELVMFYWTLGKLTTEQKRGILGHISKGNGFVTFHSGADSFRGDRDWHDFLGGHFRTHPSYRQYQVSITKVKHPITKGIDEYMTTDEQYILDYDKDKVTVLGNGLYKGDLMPALWVKPYGKGRVFYNSGGHDRKATAQSMFKKLLVRGCLWAARRQVAE